MINPIQQLEEELTGVRQQTLSLAGELKASYLKYLQVLGDCMQKQLILSAYQICIQAYPKQFLALSVNDRQRIQTKLKDLTHHSHSQITEILERVPPSPPQERVNKLPDLMEKVLKELGVEHFEDAYDDDEEEEGNEDYDFEGEQAEEYLEEELEEEAVSPFAQLIQAEEDQGIDASTIEDPAILLQWYQGVEYGLKELFAQLSKDTNQVLQDYQVLPNKVPEKLMEMVLNTNDGPSHNRRAPHILNVMVEASPKGGKKKQRKLIKIIAIRLKLSEIEFSTPLLTRHKNKIRELLTQVKGLDQQKQKIERRKTIAEADLAWRSIWFEE
ncbi:MAG: hypothetical protein HC796_12530 [Synechococcaceae cyanobacterium RL_1_2]|nr:hypothetical protein [Synechococcaceae cyanobacterium RL_1_2]